MKIAIIGAGAIGGYIGARLAGAGETVTLVARGAHLEAIRADGIGIESPHGVVRVTGLGATDDVGSIGPVDVVVAAVKLPDLDAAAAAMPALMGPATRVITLQNGIDARDIVGAHVERERIALGIIYLAVRIAVPGLVATPGGKHHMLIDALGGDATMADFFGAVGRAEALDVTPVADGEETVWQKFTAQASVAAVTALTRLPLGGVFASKEATALLERLLDEALAVAAARGVALPGDHGEATLKLYGAQPGAQSSSLAADIEAGKRTELAWLSGRVHDLGAELGVPTPMHTAAWLALAPWRDGPPVIRD